MTNRDLQQVLKLLKVLASQEVSDVSPKAKRTAGTKSRKQAYRDAVFAGFKRRGLNLTFNPSTEKFDDVLPFKEWKAQGRVVSKGQHSVRGLFHKSQTEPLAQSA